MNFIGNRLSTRFTVILTVVMTGFFLLFSVIITAYSIGSIKSQLNKRLTDLSALAQSSLSSALWQYNQTSINDFVDALFLYEDIVFVKVVSDDNSPIKVKKRPPYEGRSISDFEGSHDFITRTIPIKYSEFYVGTVQVAISRESITDIIATNTLTSILGLLGLTIVSYITVLLITRRLVLSQILLLKNSTDEISSGNLDAFINTAGKDEIGELAKSFDGMRTSIKNYIERIKKANELAKVNLKLKDEITERRKAEERVIQQNVVLEAINSVFKEALRCDSAADVAKKCLSIAEEVTGSKFGSIAEVNENGRFNTIALSNPGWEACDFVDSDEHWVIQDMEVRGIWGSALKSEHGLICNDPSKHSDSVGTPEGHLPITSFLGVPFQNEKIKGIIGVANKEGGYSESDKRVINSLAFAFVEVIARKKVEQDLKKSEARFRTFFDKSFHFALILDLEGTVLEMNMLCSAVCGKYAEGVIGRPFWEAGWWKQFPDVRDKSVAAVHRVVNGNIVNDEISFIDKDRQVHKGIRNISPIRDEQGNIQFISVVGLDITERIQMTEQLKEYSGQLEARVEERTKDLEKSNVQLQSALREMETFSYSISHDLKAPLRAITGFSNILMEDHTGGLSKEGNRILNIIHTNVIHMGDLIEDILIYSRAGREPLKKTTTNLHKLTEEILAKTLQESPERKIEIKVLPLPSCMCDRGRMNQVMTNLLGNAVKFTAKNEVAKIEIGCIEDNGKTVYYIRDNGVGFDMKYADKMFGLFQRLHSPKEFEGTGVGLAIVQRLVQRHGGRIWAEGTVNNGATFYFTLGDS